MGDSKGRVKTFLKRFFRNHDIKDDEDMFSLGFVNSLFSMQLVMFLEKEFNIKIDNQDLDMENFKTINSVVHFISKKSSFEG